MGEAEEVQVTETEEAPESQEQAAEGELSAEVTETEQTVEPTAEETAAAEEQGFRIETDEKGKQYIVDEDGTKIPPERFTKIYREAKEGERTKEKFDLFKRLGPDAYYTAFPDEKPEGWGKRETVEETVAPAVDLGSLVVKQPGGAYDGKTLREVYEVDPVFATQLQTEYLWNQKQDAVARESEASRQRTEASAELEQFSKSIMEEFLPEVGGKKADFQSLPEDQRKKIEAKVEQTIQETIEWMNKTHRGGGIIADAYELMTKGKKLSDVKTKTAQGVVESLRRSPVGHIGGGPSSQVADNYEAMTEGQLAEIVDGMSDAKKEEFYEKASPALRRKHPLWPWDDPKRE